MKNKLDIILPVYHEEDNLANVILGLEKCVKTKHRTILIYDEDDDPTISVAKKLIGYFSNISLLKNKFGRGIVSAFKTGFENSKADIIAIMMADLSDNPRDIDKMVKKIESGCDFVSASRYIREGKRKGGSIFKGFMSYFACKSLNILTKIPTTDATNAFKCFRRSLIKKIKIESIKGFEFPLEITVKAYNMKAKIAEIPTIWKERKRGKSKFRLLRLIPYYLRWYLFAIKNSLFLAK